MSETHANYVLRVLPMPAWNRETGYSALGFVEDPQGHRHGSLLLRGPFASWGRARQCGYVELHKMAADIAAANPKP
jgi:hypothetical protein